MNEDRYLLAYCWEEIGKVQWAAGAHAVASESFGRALELFLALNILDKAAAVQALLQVGDE